MGFLGARLAWALVEVLAQGMRLDWVYGLGLIAIYIAFFAIHVGESLGLLRYSW